MLFGSTVGMPLKKKKVNKVFVLPVLFLIGEGVDPPNPAPTPLEKKRMFSLLFVLAHHILCLAETIVTVIMNMHIRWHQQQQQIIPDAVRLCPVMPG